MQASLHFMESFCALPYAYALQCLIEYGYLLNSNILASQAFLAGLVSHISPSGEALSIGDKVLVTDDSLLNFAQLAVHAIQHAAGEQNRTMQEAWVCLCRTYQSCGGILAQLKIHLVYEWVYMDLLKGLKMGS